MKRFLIAIFILLFSAGISTASDWVWYSDPLTSDGQFADRNANSLTGEFYLWGFIIETDGTNNTCIEVHDGTSTSGHQVYPEFCVVGSGLAGGVLLQKPIPITTGIYGNITTTGGNVQVYFEKK